MLLRHDFLMQEELNTEPVYIEQLELMAAAAACARYDEIVSGLARIEVVYYPAARRREAISLAILEGVLPRKESLARLVGNRELTNVDRASRLAVDLNDALMLMENIKETSPIAQEIIDIFNTSDASFGKIKRADLIWSQEEDAHWLEALLLEADQANNTLDWLEAIRQIWTCGRFSSSARRVAMLFTPWCLKKAFGCSFPIYGTAQECQKHIDELREAASERNDWTSTFAHHIQVGVNNEIIRLKDVPAHRTSLKALCPSERVSSSIDAAIEFLLGTPVFNVKTFSKALDLTERGSKVVIDKLLDANILEIEGGSRNRLFVCKRTL